MYSKVKYKKDAEDIRILKGIVSKDHMHIEYPPNKSVSDIVKKLKGRSSRKLQMELQKYSDATNA